MRSVPHGWRWVPWAPQRASASCPLLLALSLALVAFLSGCSPAGGSSDGRSPSASTPTTVTVGSLPTTPAIAANGPDLTYAFVYNNQVWAHVQGKEAPLQLTHFAQPSGATIRWGPLVWSQSGKYLAFALVVNQTPRAITSSSGALYYLDTSSCLTSDVTCQVYQTPGVGSIYGHTYSWYRNDMLIYGSGAGLTLYDVADPNGARTWQARIVSNADPTVDIGDEQCVTPRMYGDVQVVGETLYYTCLTLSDIGGVGVVGSALLYQLDLSPIGAIEATYDPTNLSTAFTRDESLGRLFNQAVLGQALQGSVVVSLGSAYTDHQGNIVAGAWAARG
ncbi:MAG TPA: hypothetical protein VKQ36_14945, partial [Ktedonobacterales bacterium]|nr:hypothetical protein [Ktedonobacterales bacterium]